MIRSLLRKEARLQAPFLVLVLIFIAIEWVDILVQQSPETWQGESVMEVLGGLEIATAIAMFLLIFSFGAGLLTRELDDQTQEFLDALPVSRSSAFVGKMILAFLLLGLLVLSDTAEAAWSLGLSAHSLRPTIPWRWVLSSSILTGVQLSTFFSLGLVLSFARPYAWIGFGLLFWTQQLLVAFEPRARLLDPFTLGSDYLRSTPVVWPTLHVSVLVGISVVALALSYVAYLRPVRRYASETPDTKSSGPQRFLRFLVVPLTSVLAISTLGYVALHDSEPPRGSLTKPRRAVANAKTEHFAMTYPNTLADRARRLLETADPVHDDVAGMLDATDLAVIAVDATGSSIRSSGSAQWSKIRLDLKNLREPKALIAVLAHETTHVYVSRISRRRADDDPMSSFVHEGIATLIEYQLYRTDEERRRLRTIAAAIDERQKIPFSTLLDVEALRLRYAPEVVYPLGERFFASVTERNGIDGVRRVLSTLGGDEFPSRPSGIDRLRVAFQIAGYDLEVEIAAWKAALAADRRQLKDEVASLPRLVASVEESDDSIHFDTEREAPPGYVLACRFRPGVDAPESTWHQVRVSQGSTCAIDGAAFPRPFQYQLGLLEVGTDRQIWEEWENLAQ